MADFVLVHGSWHDGSAYAPIARRLEDRGHDAHAPTIAGHGPGADKDVDHADCTQSIVEYIVDNSLDGVVLHGHSFGGTVISKVAEQIPERIERLVFQSAFVLDDGHCLLDELPPHHRELMHRLAAEADDGTIMLPFDVWRDQFINDATLEQARSAYEQLSPEPFQPFTEELDLSEFYSLDVPASYLYATEDTALPQGPEWGFHPRMSSRLGMFRLVTMAGSHEVVFTKREQLTDAIIRAGRE